MSPPAAGGAGGAGGRMLLVPTMAGCAIAVGKAKIPAVLCNVCAGNADATEIGEGICTPGGI